MVAVDAKKCPASACRPTLAAPSLAGVAQRLYLGGTIANTPDNLVHWIVNPKKFDPQTVMPVTGISVSEARDVAAYLYRPD